MRAYAAGLFPMAPARDSDAIEWYSPQHRGVLPLDDFHASRKLMRTVLGGRFEVSADTSFCEVMNACAAPAHGREDTWISTRLTGLYVALHDMGYAHSVEVRHDGKLVGGLYGVALGGAFFGESMFSHMTDASKVALVHLVAGLRQGGFSLLDAQYRTDHLARFGCREISAGAYHDRLAEALSHYSHWPDSFSLDALGEELRAVRAVRA
nr:leucyl/phenylalanyl-tRNA--protein transferase [Tanticharoenia sakaeratensis]